MITWSNQYNVLPSLMLKGNPSQYTYLHTCIFLQFKQLKAEVKNLNLVSNQYTDYEFDTIVRHYISSWSARLLSYVFACEDPNEAWRIHSRKLVLEKG